VMEVDVKRQRVALTMRMSDTPGAKTSGPGGRPESGRPPQRDRDSRGGYGAGAARSQSAPPASNAMAEAFAKLKGGK